jgi:hypothetical protein
MEQSPEMVHSTPLPPTTATPSVGFPSQIPMDPPSSKSKLPLILILISLLVMIGGTVYLGVKINQSKQASMQPTQAPPKISVPTAIPNVTNSSNAILEKYTSCGCGCCNGTKPQQQCIYKSKGQLLETIKREDEKTLKNNAQLCQNVGCSLGIEYKYCDK